ncbi:unnamed protein product [Musa acuminata subsp. malaccensis]|uniref:(wild Malaysian banana) hypothetical protein n=1 Tax=Musa acuminata subsp. malaccensis TaxID=214687 RepID=A0A804IZI8_MUSAM|nr:unnamed protein product [Musa acuminata subsp. malaccensis]
MAGGAILRAGNGGKDYPGKMTLFVFLACLVASSSGLIFGYDIGISGGVTSMDGFLVKFFPSVYRQEKEDASTNQYCRFDSQLLTAFTSSLYLAALIASFFASTVTRAFGRKWSMFGGGITFLVGAAINGAAESVLMLLLGRILLGVGSVPLYLSEMAPAKLRGMLNIGFQLMITIGILAANLINYATAKIKARPWREGPPHAPEDPRHRGHPRRVRRHRVGVRGVAGDRAPVVDHPAAEVQAAAHHGCPHPLLPTGHRHQRHHVLRPRALQDRRVRRRRLPHVRRHQRPRQHARHLRLHRHSRQSRPSEAVPAGGVQMFISQAIVGTMIAIKFGTSGSAASLSNEIFPLEIRPAGQAITVSVNMLFTFMVAQAFVAALCHLKFGLFYLFAAWVVVMTVFVAFFLPETKNVPIEEMILVWQQHWYWGKFIADEDVNDDVVGSIEMGKNRSYTGRVLTMQHVNSCIFLELVSLSVIFSLFSFLLRSSIRVRSLKAYKCILVVLNWYLQLFWLFNCCLYEYLITHRVSI